MEFDYGRSYAHLTLRHLERFARFAAREHQSWSDTRHDVKGQPVAAVLAQGVAQHFLSCVTGVKDFDVWCSTITRFLPAASPSVGSIYR